MAASFLLGDQILSSDAIRALNETDRLAYYASEASAVQIPFVLLALAFFALAGVVGAITLPKILGEDSEAKTTYGEVLQNRKLLFGALGIFVYVGAEVALGSYMVNYGLSLDIVEEVKTSGCAGQHGRHCSIHQRNRCLRTGRQRDSWSVADVLLGWCDAGAVRRFCTDAAHSSFKVACGCRVFGVDLDRPVHAESRRGCVVVGAGRGVLQQHHVPHHLHLGH